MAREDTRFHPLVAALYDPVQTYFEHVQAPAHRTHLADGLDGDVLELGVGTGAMFPYYADHAAPDGRLRLHGVEPDPGMWKRARDRLREVGVEMELVSATAEALPYAEEAFDAVVESGVLCSVQNVDAALAEIARVLAPDGEFRFFDHVRSEGIVGRTQDALTPAWRRIGGNCHLDRNIGATLVTSDHLDVVSLDRVAVGYWPIREFVRGRAVPSGR